MELQRCTLKGSTSIYIFSGWRTFFQVGDETVGGFGLDDYIIDVSFDIVAYLLIKAHLDGPLVGHPGVLESEGHGGIAIRTERRDERHLDLVLLEGCLVIAEVIVKEGEQFIADGGVYNLVYPRQTKGVFRAVFVEIGVINAHSPFFILLSYKNRVGKPL